jgi:hypothetical protein
MQKLLKANHLIPEDMKSEKAFTNYVNLEFGPYFSMRGSIHT